MLVPNGSFAPRCDQAFYQVSALLCILGSSQIRGWCKSSGCKIFRINAGWEVLHLYFLRKHVVRVAFFSEMVRTSCILNWKGFLASLCIPNFAAKESLPLCFWFGFPVEMHFSYWIFLLIYCITGCIILFVVYFHGQGAWVWKLVLRNIPGNQDERQHLELKC